MPRVCQLPQHSTLDATHHHLRSHGLRPNYVPDGIWTNALRASGCTKQALSTIRPRMNTRKVHVLFSLACLVCACVCINPTQIKSYNVKIIVWRYQISIRISIPIVLKPRNRIFEVSFFSTQPYSLAKCRILWTECNFCNSRDKISQMVTDPMRTT